MSGGNQKYFIVAGSVIVLVTLLYFLSSTVGGQYSMSNIEGSTTTTTTTTTTAPTSAPNSAPTITPCPTLPPQTQPSSSPSSPSSPPRRLSKEEVKQTLTRFGQKLNEIVKQPDCELIVYGTGWGRHEACKMEFSNKCHFYSFGISGDYSFDTDFNAKTGCRGVGLDPTITHSSQLASEGRVLFFQVGATSLDPLPEDWKVTSVPALKKWLKHDRIFMLKMDCEGCEYAIARDVVLEDPEFFYKVDQFAVEIHVSKFWISTEDHLHYYALLVKLLEEAGLLLRGAFLTPCSNEHEAYGCPDVFSEIAYPCSLGIMCQNIVFARV